MRVAIRTDASIQSGTGHFFRCLTLAQDLKLKGVDSVFVCRKLSQDLSRLLLEKGFPVLALKRSFEEEDWDLDLPEMQLEFGRSGKRLDWLIVDQYSLDRRWESQAREFAKRIMVIDDLANRKHDCDLLLDQNYYQDSATRYLNLVPAHCVQLLGPEYALLRSEFRISRSKLRRRSGEVRRVLVFFGGSDPTGESLKAVEGIERFSSNTDMRFDLVVGALNPSREDLVARARKLPYLTVHTETRQMGKLMESADLSLGAGGTTTWERCRLGLPALVTIVAGNQRQVAEELSSFGAIQNLGWHEDVSTDFLYESMVSVCGDRDRVRNMSQKALEVMGTSLDSNELKAVGAILEADFAG
ncbi:MAG: UDP-2,4-diacetamido-2,4,6-trideoxy-beta-L-altropyranose hydrolase [Bdellovibrionota bacterium]